MCELKHFPASSSLYADIYISQISFNQSGPFSVKNLNASTEEESITVMWVKPNEYKDSYRYNVTWQSSDGWLYSNTTDGTKYDIDGLVPGSLYILSVTTETSDGTQGASEWISNCTSMVITHCFTSHRRYKYICFSTVHCVKMVTSKLVLGVILG